MNLDNVRLLEGLELMPLAIIPIASYIVYQATRC